MQVELSARLATNGEIELDDLCPTTAAEVVENLSEDNKKGVDFESPLEDQNWRYCAVHYCSYRFLVWKWQIEGA